MDIGSLIPVSAGRATLSAKPTPEQAAQEFETMLIAQLMKTAREAGQLDPEEDSLAGSQSYLEFAEKYLAEALGAGGVFGFGKMILDDLVQPAGQSVNDEASSPGPDCVREQ